MLSISRNFALKIERPLILSVRNSSAVADDEFKVLNLKTVRSRAPPRKPRVKQPLLPPRYKQMSVDQDWGSVWPAPRSFQPATVPLPLHQGAVEKRAPPGKFANAELMKIPNFLHLTPPVIKRQCEALKQFCTKWPQALDTDEKCEKLFPLEIASSDYCHASPTIRDPLARIVTLRIRLSALDLDAHARDKLLRLVGERYDETTDVITIVTDRCPTKKQNYDYAMYLLTALFHESWRVEPWEAQKSEADMEYYDWKASQSRKSLEQLFEKSYEEIENSAGYVAAVDKLMNEGESEYLTTNYGNAVRKLLQLPEEIATN